MIMIRYWVKIARLIGGSGGYKYSTVHVVVIVQFITINS